MTEQLFTARDVLARYSNLTDDHLRYLRKWRLVRPSSRGNAAVYGFGDLGVIRQVSAALTDQRSFRAIVRSLLAERHGQLALDFQAVTTPAKVLRLTPRPPSAPQVPEADADAQPLPSRRAEELFLQASALDNGDPALLDQAAARYREALGADSELVPALINLGNAHYTRGQMAEAQALYERAIGLAPEYVEAHFNLANVLHDSGRFDDACLSYRDALVIDPRCAEAHFYLAVALEKLGRSVDARPHWRAYRDLAPQGEWVELAREFGE